MEIRENVSLRKYTTLKIGGTAKKFYEVNTLEDIKRACSITNNNFKILANGSNLLINDKKEFDNIIYINSYEKKIFKEDDIFIATASVKIQELINYINANENGGIEYLISVPATVGGAIYMNAGRGKLYNKSISDYIIDVTIFDGKEVRVLEKEQCLFGYRESIFKTKNWIILSARFKFDRISIEETSQLKKDRIDFSKNNLDSNNKSAGSVFRIYNPKIMNIFKKYSIGWENGIQYSNKTINWINNNGNGSYLQAKILINSAIIIHKFLFKEIKLEYIEWK